MRAGTHLLPRYGASSRFDLALSNRIQTEDWIGARTSEGRSQALVLRLGQGPNGGGTVDLPDFGALAIPAVKSKLTKSHVHFELVGDASTAVFDGSITQEEIHGHWTEENRSGDFTLRRSTRLAGGIVLVKKDIFIQNGDVRLSGTMVMPRATVSVPGIVFVHGAGPETRQAFLFLAEYFAQHGVAALIYDKRGAGESKGDWKHASFETLAGDVEYERRCKTRPQCAA